MRIEYTITYIPNGVTISQTIEADGPVAPIPATIPATTLSEPQALHLAPVPAPPVALGKVLANAVSTAPISAGGDPSGGKDDPSTGGGPSGGADDPTTGGRTSDPNTPPLDVLMGGSGGKDDPTTGGGGNHGRPIVILGAVIVGGQVSVVNPAAVRSGAPK